jgi:hypothetical protein
MERDGTGKPGPDQPLPRDLTMTFSASSRSALRSALKAAPGWTAYRDANGLDLSTMSVQALKDAASALSLDVFAIVTGVASNGAAVEADTSSRAIRAAASSVRDNGNIQSLDALDDDDDAGDDAAALLRAVQAVAGRSLNRQQVTALVQREIAAALEGQPTVRLEVMKANGEAKAIGGHKHPAFAKLLRTCCARAGDGYSPNVWLAGPAGSGKTTGARMVADALELAFHFNGAIGMQHELLGFIDAAGTYHRTPFREAYEHGGVYLFDEVDGSDNAALLALNAALANGRATFPDGQVERHPECRIIAAANTFGHGATAEYVGRSKIDAAFLSRFPVRIVWDYDAALEVAIAGNADFARRVQGARERARAAGLKVLITPRDSIAGSALIAAGFDADEAASMTYLASLTVEQARMVEGRV